MTWDTPERTKQWRGRREELTPIVRSRRRNELLTLGNDKIVPAWLGKVNTGLCDQLIQQIRDGRISYDGATTPNETPRSTITAGEREQIVKEANHSTTDTLGFTIKISRDLSVSLEFQPLKIQAKSSDQVPRTTAKENEWSLERHVDGHRCVHGVYTSFTGGRLFRPYGSDSSSALWRLEQGLLPRSQPPSANDPSTTNGVPDEQACPALYMESGESCGPHMRSAAGDGDPVDNVARSADDGRVADDWKAWVDFGDDT